jgi:kynurenine formamidase
VAQSSGPTAVLGGLLVGVLAASLVGAVGCARVSEPPPQTVPEPGAIFDLAAAEIVDLSHAYGDDTLYWPTSPSKFEFEVLAYGMTPGGFFYSANSFSTPEHGGTHLDAPIHFAREGWTADEIPLARLIGPAVVIDVSAKAAADPDYRLDPEDLFAWETDHGLVPEGAIVLLRTGWSARWPDALAYLGDDTPGDASNLHFPGYGEEAARTLVEQRRVAVLGLDTASIDHGPSTDFIVHQVANGANVAGLENLTNLDRVPDTGAWVLALPMKIAGGSGGPARVVALVPPAS